MSMAQFLNWAITAPQSKPIHRQTLQSSATELLKSIHDATHGLTLIVLQAHHAHTARRTAPPD